MQSVIRLPFPFFFLLEVGLPEVIDQLKRISSLFYADGEMMSGSDIIVNARLVIINDRAQAKRWAPDADQSEGPETDDRGLLMRSLPQLILLSRQSLLRLCLPSSKDAGLAF